MKPDPFHNPSEELLISRLPNSHQPTHNLVLNKYPVISNHFILSTVAFKKQTDILEGEDLAITYACLQAWAAEPVEHSPGQLFAFFNSGGASGASQAHRHLQFLPVEDMKDSVISPVQWRPLIDLLLESGAYHGDFKVLAGLPLKHFALPFPSTPSPNDLVRIYHTLYKLAADSIGNSKARETVETYHPGSDTLPATFSYNLAMTTKGMAICPRSSESAKIPAQGGTGHAAVNGTLLAGTFMLKEESEWTALRSCEVDIDELLVQLGHPVPKDEKILANR